MTVVPGLKDKLKAVRELGLSRVDLLNELGIASDSTLRWYESGDAKRDPGKVPADVFAKLVALFVSRLPGKRSAAEVIALLCGPPEAVRTAFQSGSAVIWWTLIERVAARTGGRLVREADIEFGLVEVDDPDDDHDAPEVELDERFSLVFAVPVSGYHLVLQHAHRTWAAVPFATKEWTVERTEGSLTVPGVDRSRRSRFLVERRDLGRHRFVCVSTRAPFPQSTKDAARQGLLDLASLDQLAGFYEKQLHGNRHMIILDVTVLASTSPLRA